MTVVWSENAQTTFDTIVSYVELNFGFASAKKFVEKVDSIINTVATHPYSYKHLGSNKKIRKATVNRQCSFFYEINSNNILLLYFWDNRQEPLF